MLFVYAVHRTSITKKVDDMLYSETIPPKNYVTEDECLIKIHLAER